MHEESLRQKYKILILAYEESGGMLIKIKRTDLSSFKTLGVRSENLRTIFLRRASQSFVCSTEMQNQIRYNIPLLMLLFTRTIP